MYGWDGLWKLNLIVAAGFGVVPYNISGGILRGTKIVTVAELQRSLNRKETKLLKRQVHRSQKYEVRSQKFYLFLK